VNRRDAEVLAARWRLGGITPFDLRSIVGDLLDAGESSPSLIELFALPKDAGPWEGPELFERALVELGAPDADELGDAVAVADWLARSVLDGSMSSRRACELAARMYVASGYKHNALAPYYGFDDDYGWRSSEAVDRDVHRFAEEIVAQAS